jgi:hypothetical protein
VKIKKEIRSFHKIFNDLHNPQVTVRFLVSSGELAVHVSVCAASVVYNGEEIRPRDHNQIPSLQGDLRIQIGSQVPAGLIPLYSTND